MSPTPYRLIEAQHGEGCDLDEHHWVTLQRRGQPFHVRQCTSCYTIDFDGLAAEFEAEHKLYMVTLGIALRHELLARLLDRR